MATLLCNIWRSLDPMANCDVTSLVASGKCFQCLDAKSTQVAMLQLLCNISDSISGGTGSVVCSLVDPTVDPGVSCQLWVNTAKGWLWNWDDAFTTWRPLISA